MVSKEPKWNALCMFHFLVTRTYQTIFLGRATHSANKLLNKWILQIIQNLQGTLRTTNIKPVDTLIPWSNQKIEHNFSHQKVPCLSLLHVSWAEKWRHSYSSTTCGRPPAIANSNLNWFRLLTTKSKAWKHVRSRAGLDVYFTFLQQREDWMRWRFFPWNINWGLVSTHILSSLCHREAAWIGQHAEKHIFWPFPSQHTCNFMFPHGGFSGFGCTWQLQPQTAVFDTEIKC